MAASWRVFQFRLGRAARRWRAALAGVACGIALAGSIAGGGLPAAAATSPWSVQQTPPLDTKTPNAQFFDVSCPTGTWCMAVGEYVGTDGIGRTLSERWDGSAWHIVFPRNPVHTLATGLGAVSCVSATSCQAVGNAGAGLLAESWNGKAWRTVPIMRPGNVILRAISCATARFCVTAGSRITASGLEQAITERWNGRRWSVVIPQRPRVTSHLTGVSCPGVRNCYAVGSDSASLASVAHPLIEHWNGRGWSTQAIPRPSGNAVLNAVSCPTATSCTAVGSVGTNDVRMLVEDLSRGRWNQGLPAVPAEASSSSQFYAVSCSAPRVCTALLSYINSGEELTWATASRAVTGGFRVTLPRTDVARDNAAAVSCRRAGCTIAGGLNVSDGRGDSTNTGTTFGWRGSGGHFVPQVTLNPPGTAGGSLTNVSCVASGFCAATTSSSLDFVAPGDPSVLVRTTAHGNWTIPANAGSGFLSSLSCTSASFCLAMGSASGAESWNGSSWSEVSAPDHFDPNNGGLQTVSCFSPTSCLAVGGTEQGSSEQALAASWNGSSWTILSPAKPAGSARSVLTGVSCTSATACVANGYFLPTPAALPRALIETWNETTWTIAAPHMRVSADLTSFRVSCATASACMAIWGASGSALAEWWNGTTWIATTLAGPTGRSYVRSIYGISCAAPTSCTAVGNFSYPHSGGQLVETWNGSTWAVAASASPGVGFGTFSAASCTSATVCTAVGSVQRIETVPFAEARG